MHNFSENILDKRNKVIITFSHLVKVEFCFSAVISIHFLLGRCPEFGDYGIGRGSGTFTDLYITFVMWCVLPDQSVGPQGIIFMIIFTFVVTTKRYLLLFILYMTTKSNGDELR